MPPEQALYRAFELVIASGISMPELEDTRRSGDCPVDADVNIRLAAVDGPMPSPHEWRTMWIETDVAYFAWQSVGRVRVTGGRSIEVDPLPDFDQRLLGLFLLGPVMAALLHQRGLLVLHGSAVEIAPGRAVLFLGDNGAGKSTIAAAFLKAGHQVLTDDVIALDIVDMVRVRAAFPAMKLSREALEVLKPLPGEILPPCSVASAKQRFRYNAAYAQESLTVGEVYVLERGDVNAIAKLGSAEALGALMRYSYIPKFGQAALTTLSSASYFRQCTMVADRVPVSRLSVPEGLDTLSRVVEAVRTNAQK